MYNPRLPRAGPAQESLGSCMPTRTNSKSTGTRSSSAPAARGGAKTTAKKVAKAPAKKVAKAVPAKKVAKAAAKSAPAKKVAKTPAKKAAAPKKPAVAKAPVKKADPKVKQPAAKATAKKADPKTTKTAAPAKAAPAKVATKAAAKATAAAVKAAPAKKAAAPKKPPVQTKAAPVRFLEPLGGSKRSHGTSLAESTVEKLRAQLIAERDVHLSQAEALAAEAEELASEREPGDTQFDEESGEGDTLTIERERDLALSATARQTVEDIEKALARMAEDRYGYCEMCGDRIPIARLEAIPWADLCVRCKSRGERRR